jgi:hypothetical protein
MSEISTAVLTPHLNHPNFSGGSDYCKRCNYAHKKERNHWYHGHCLTMKEKFRQRWSNQQVVILKNMPSNAVLGA